MVLFKETIGALVAAFSSQLEDSWTQILFFTLQNSLLLQWRKGGEALTWIIFLIWLKSISA